MWGWGRAATRSAQELERFVSRLRVYAISDQDDSGPWIRENFPRFFYIVSPGINASGGYHHATWAGIAGDNFHGRFAGADSTLVSNEWLEQNVPKKGPLGAGYPHWEFMMEGDTPSFLNLVNNGLSDPERPDWGGWGGRYELYTPRKERWFVQEEMRPIWTNAQDEVMVAWQVAHHQPCDHLALAQRDAERLRRAHGLDRQALCAGQPPTGAEGHACGHQRAARPARRAERERQP